MPRPPLVPLQKKIKNLGQNVVESRNFAAISLAIIAVINTSQGWRVGGWWVGLIKKTTSKGHFLKFIAIS